MTPCISLRRGTSKLLELVPYPFDLFNKLCSKQNTICQKKHTRNLATNGGRVVRNGSHDNGNLAKSSTLHELRLSITNEPLKYFLSKQLNQTFFTVVQ